MVPIDQTDQYTSQRNPSQDLLDLYQDVIADIKPSYWQVLKDRPRLKFDSHPSPDDHLYYLDQVLPEFTVSDTTRLQIANETATIKQSGIVPGTVLEYKKPNVIRA
jgi:hypothetical protein